MQVEHLAAGHSEGVQEEVSVGRQYELVVVRVKVVLRDLFALEGVRGGLERAELLTYLSVLEALERLHSHFDFVQMLNDLREGEGRSL